MGTSSSRTRRMENSDEVSTNGDGDSDIAQLLQYLIRSGQVHIIATDRDDSSDDEHDFNVPLSPPSTIENPNTEVLDNSSFHVMTASAAGLRQKTGQQRAKSIASLVCARERGLPGSGALTRGDRCRLLNNFLPNKQETITNYHSKIFCGSFSQDGSTFLTASQDKRIRLYDVQKGFKLSKTIFGRNVGWSILDTAFSPDGQYVAYSSWSECLHLFSLRDDSDHQETMLLSPFDRRFCIFSLVFSSGGNEILCGANDGNIYIYDRGCDKRILRIPSHDDDVNTVAFADDTSQIVYSGGDDGIIKVWDRRTLCEQDPQPVGMLGGHMDGVTFIEPRGDGRHLLSNSKDQSIKLWDVRLFSPEKVLNRTKKAVESQSWDYRWQGIPKAFKDPNKKVPGDTSIMTYCGHAVLQTLCRCHFSPLLTTGQKYIYAGCASGRVVIYDALTGQIATELIGHRACVRDVAWHPHHPEIVSTSWDGNVLLWSYCEANVPKQWTFGDPKEGSEPYGPVRRSQRIRDRMKRLQT